MSANIVHEYFKKEIEGAKILVKLNPIHWKGTELTVAPDGTVEIRELEFDEDIHEDLKADGFEPSNPLEFNLHFSGLV